MSISLPITLKNVLAVSERIKPYIHLTKVLTCETVNERLGAQLYFKCENFQKTGAFKMRGAANAVFGLDDDTAVRGVATHSSGNHGAAVALAARNRGIPAYVVMPTTVPKVKQDAVKSYGAEVIICEPGLAAREKALLEVVERTGAVEIHPYNDYRIIAGQATAAMELLEQVPELDVMLAPVSGGGLLSGTALASKLMSPSTRVIGVEPEGADDAYRSFKSGTLIPCDNPQTIADGLRGSLGDKTFEMITALVDDVVTVSEEAIIEAMREIWQRMKIIVEPAAAVPLAAILSGRLDISGKRVGIILSGGNVDLESLPWNE